VKYSRGPLGNRKRNPYNYDSAWRRTQSLPAAVRRRSSASKVALVVLETGDRRTRLTIQLRSFGMRQRASLKWTHVFSLCGTSRKSILSQLRDREDPSKRWRMDSFFVENLKLRYQHNRMREDWSNAKAI
jgi:hypothetical protein